MVYFAEHDDRLLISYYGETVWLEAWGPNGLRMRGTKEEHMPEKDWALLEENQTKAKITVGNEEASVTNGKITAMVNTYGRVTFIHNTTGKVLLKESWRYRVDNPVFNSLEIKKSLYPSYLLGLQRFSQFPGIW